MKIGILNGGRLTVVAQRTTKNECIIEEKEFEGKKWYRPIWGQEIQKISESEIKKSVEEVEEILEESKWRPYASYEEWNIKFVGGKIYIIATDNKKEIVGVYDVETGRKYPTRWENSPYRKLGLAHINGKRYVFAKNYEGKNDSIYDIELDKEYKCGHYDGIAVKCFDNVPKVYYIKKIKRENYYIECESEKVFTKMGYGVELEVKYFGCIPRLCIKLNMNNTTVYKDIKFNRFFDEDGNEVIVE